MWKPSWPDFGKYCKYQLIKFKPWEGEPSNAWGNKAESDEMFINTYHLFLHTDFAEENAIGRNQEMCKFFARQSVQDEEDGDNERSYSNHNGINCHKWLTTCQSARLLQDSLV